MSKSSVAGVFMGLARACRPTTAGREVTTRDGFGLGCPLSWPGFQALKWQLGPSGGQNQASLGRGEPGSVAELCLGDSSLRTHTLLRCITEVHLLDLEIFFLFLSGSERGVAGLGQRVCLTLSQKVWGDIVTSHNGIWKAMRLYCLSSGVTLSGQKGGCFVKGVHKPRMKQ